MGRSKKWQQEPFPLDKRCFHTCGHCKTLRMEADRLEAEYWCSLCGRSFCDVHIERHMAEYHNIEGGGRHLYYYERRM